MSRIDNIITEAINNQVNLSVARGNRDEIERRIHSIESNGNAMQNQFVADTVAYGYGIINAYDKGNVGQSTERNTVYRGYSNNYVGNGFGYRFIRGALNDLGRAGYSQLTNPLQSSLNDYINGKNWYYRNFGNRNRNRNAQQTQQRRPNNGAYTNNTLMDLLSPSERNRRYNQFRQIQNTLPTNTSRDMFEFFRQIKAMYIALTNGQPQQSAAQMQAGQQAQQNQQQRAQVGQQPQQAAQTGTQPAQGTPRGTRTP